ncbi:MAG: hypothetical protein IT449_04850 [Phycisphaerales bacterium]|nr:hypothetical protein [Phycisphaerales bacterium]
MNRANVNTMSMTHVIQEAFKRSGWSVNRLSKESGVPYASAFNFIHGKATVTLDTADGFCAALGLALTALDNPKPAKPLARVRARRAGKAGSAKAGTPASGEARSPKGGR